MTTITITGDTPLEALSSLLAFGMSCGHDPRVREEAERIAGLKIQRINAYQRQTDKLLEKMRKEEAQESTPPARPETPQQPEPQQDPTYIGSFPPDDDLPFDESDVVEHKEPEPEKEPKPEPAPAKQKQSQGKAPIGPNDVMSAGIDAARRFGQPAVKALLTKLGANSITTLPENKWEEFLAGLKELSDNA